MKHSAETKRVALVTGGAKRVGRAIVDRLLSSGFAVAFTYMSSEADADALRKTYGERVRPIFVDLTAPQKAVADVGAGFSEFADRLDVLVNNASLYQPGRLQETTPEQLRKLNAIHVESPVLLCQAFEKKLRAS